MKQFLARFILKHLLGPPLLPCVDFAIRKDGLTTLASLCYASMFLSKTLLRSRQSHWTVSHIGNT